MRKALGINNLFYHMQHFCFMYLKIKGRPSKPIFKEIEMMHLNFFTFHIYFSKLGSRLTTDKFIERNILMILQRNLFFCVMISLEQSVQHGYRKPENPRKKPVKAGTGQDRFEILRLQVSRTRTEEVQKPHGFSREFFSKPEDPKMSLQHPR